MIIVCGAVAVVALVCVPVAFAQPDSGARAAVQDNTLSASGAMVADWIDDSGAGWIWPERQQGKANQYVQVLHRVSVPEVGARAELVISADTEYAVWLNGVFVDFGQWSNFPDDKTYDVLDVTEMVKAGANRLCIEVFYQGESSSTYRKGRGGVLYALRAGDDVVAVSGEESLMRRSPGYVSGPMPKVSGQLGFAFEYRADRDDDWREAGYRPGKRWARPAADEILPLAERPVRPRPVAKLVLEDRAPMKIVAQGAFERTQPEDRPAVAMQTDALSHRGLGELFLGQPRDLLSDADTTGMVLRPEAWEGMTGAYVVLDVGREEAGLLELELDAPAGTVIDVGYGEHLEDLRVRTSIGGRNFAVRYTAREGRQISLHPFLRLAGRYVQLNITPPAGSEHPVVLQYAGLRPTPYPAEHRGEFVVADELHRKIWEVSRRTLELCMHEHYEDCPWREQALYAMDARNQALAGYYCFGNYDFAAASIKLLGQGMNEGDGFLELCAPADVGVNIPSFSMAWILMLDDHLLFSGDREFAESQIGVVHDLLARMDRETSGPIVATPKGPRMWNFYEWAPGLDGNGVGGRGALAEDRLEAPLNLFYLLALDATARMMVDAGEDATTYTQRAAELRRAFGGTFWDEEEKAFVTRVNDDQPKHFAELTQALAILANVVPENRLAALRERLASDDNGMVPCTISHTLYKFEALLTDKEQYGARVFELIARDWGYMLGQGATSFWETIDGASAFSDAGSLCHGWSGVPAWFYGAHVLGVRPTAPGFEAYEAVPAKAAFAGAEGRVPLPDGGAIVVEWDGEGVRAERAGRASRE